MNNLKTNRLNLTTRIAILVAALLLVISITLGTVLILRSRAEMMEMINARMLDITKVAASMLNGDELRDLTGEDADTPAYRKVMETLTHFQDNIELSYIYCIRDMKDGTFTFGVDPTVLDPGDFGSPIVYTKALDSAAHGTPAVDEKAYEDQWGKFYSAYSPVFTSTGEVGGIVAADFDAAWIEKELRKSARIVWIGCLASLLLGVVSVVLLTGGLRKKLKAVNEEITGLGESVDVLSRELSLHTILRKEELEALEPAEPVDEISALSLRIRSLREQLRAYVARSQLEATMDKLTGANNQSSYVAMTKRLDKDIERQMANFTLVICDLDHLKEINDEYGHDAGDAALSDAARLIGRAFGPEHTYRVGGDEFAAILENRSEAEASLRMQNLERLIREFNQNEKPYEFELDISTGMAAFEPETDENFRAVFRRADQDMYSQKKTHHQLTRIREEREQFGQGGKVT